jgi:hypothetical protein
MNVGDICNGVRFLGAWASFKYFLPTLTITITTEPFREKQPQPTSLGWTLSLKEKLDLLTDVPLAGSSKRDKIVTTVQFPVGPVISFI